MADVVVVALLLFNLEEAWCAGVTEPHYTEPWLFRCEDNDGFLSLTYQGRTGAVTTENWTNAKAHTSETQEADRIRDLLILNFGVQ